MKDLNNDEIPDESVLLENEHDTVDWITEPLDFPVLNPDYAIKTSFLV